MKATVEYHNGTTNAVKTHKATFIDLDYGRRYLVVNLYADGNKFPTGRAIYRNFVSVDLDMTA